MCIFYQALTQYLGFLNYGDDYKIIGLAPYGTPKYLKEMQDIVKLLPNGKFELNLKYFLHHLVPMNFQNESGSPQIFKLFS